MKKLIIITALVLFMLHPVIAMPPTVDLWFRWTPNPSIELVTSYVIQKAIGTSTNFVDVTIAPGTTNIWAVKGLTNNTYMFRLIAINGSGRSRPSKELIYPTNAPSSPNQFQFTVPPQPITPPTS